jgi:hypothetical protein
MEDLLLRTVFSAGEREQFNHFGSRRSSLFDLFLFSLL